VKERELLELAGALPLHVVPKRWFRALEELKRHGLHSWHLPEQITRDQMRRLVLDPERLAVEIMARLMRRHRQQLIAENRQKCVHSPVKAADTELARVWGFNSAEAANRWLRRHRPGRKPR
jgi:hypothetical protein